MEIYLNVLGRRLFYNCLIQTSPSLSLTLKALSDVGKEYNNQMNGYETQTNIKKT